MFSCGNSITSALVPVPLALVAVLDRGMPSAPASSSSMRSTLTPRAPVCFSGVCKTLKNGSCQFSLCLAKALICREGTRTCCQQADNAALMSMLFASVKFSIAAMDPFVFSLHICFVLKILITFTNTQQNFFPILCCILEFF